MDKDYIALSNELTENIMGVKGLEKLTPQEYEILKSLLSHTMAAHFEAIFNATVTQLVLSLKRGIKLTATTASVLKIVKREGSKYFKKREADRGLSGVDSIGQ